MTDKQPNALKLFQFQMLIMVKCADILLQWASVVHKLNFEHTVVNIINWQALYSQPLIDNHSIDKPSLTTTL